MTVAPESTIIRKWADKLGILKDYRWEFEKALAVLKL